MWSLDWFAARDLARRGSPIRRVAWAYGTWLIYMGCLWQMRLPDLTWRVATAEDFAAAEFRARDWTTHSYDMSECGSLPAYNAAPPVEKSWGDTPEMLPRPVPNTPEAAP